MRLDTPSQDASASALNTAAFTLITDQTGAGFQVALGFNFLQCLIDYEKKTAISNFFFFDVMLIF